MEDTASSLQANVETNVMASYRWIHESLAHASSAKNYREEVEVRRVRSRSEVMREALRVYELFENQDYDSELEEQLREGLRSPLRRYAKNHFAKLLKPGAKRAAA